MSRAFDQLIEDIVETSVESCGWSGPILWVHTENGYVIHLYDNVIYLGDRILLTGSADLAGLIGDTITDLTVLDDTFKLTFASHQVLHIDAYKNCETARVFKKNNSGIHWTFEDGIFERSDRKQSKAHEATDNSATKCARSRPRINEEIMTPVIRVINEEGVQLGAMETTDALAMARKANLDLIEIASEARPPVTRMMDYGKHLFELKKQERQACKLHKDKTQTIRLRPSTNEHDMEIKAKHARSFLDDGARVEIRLQMRSSEVHAPEQGIDAIYTFIKILGKNIVIEKSPHIDNKRLITAVIVPSQFRR